MCKQVFYNMGFNDTENSTSVVVFQAQRLEFLEGWMAAVNAIGLLESSVFKDPNQIPLPNDPLIQALTQEQSDEEGDKKGEDNPSMAELAKQIDSHMVVINVDNSATTIIPKGQGTPEVNLGSTPLNANEVSSATPTVTQDPIP